MSSTIQLRDRIYWMSHGQRKQGTVVKIQRYPWCPGASQIIALSDDDCTPTSFNIGMGYWRIEGATETLSSCRARYIDHLSQYAAWRENFSAGITVGNDWGEFNGSKLVAVRS